MLEILICSLVTILPDYLFRRYRQGKRFGHEITLFSVWYELRYGITSCLILAVSLITVIFYFHPSTVVATSFYRTISILPDANGRVAEVFVASGDEVAEGQPLFRLDDAREKAALDSAASRVAEIDAAMAQAANDLTLAMARLTEAESALDQALVELRRNTDLESRNSNVVAQREIERLQITVQGREASVAAARAGVASAQTQITTVLPAQKASAEAARTEAQVLLDRTLVRAGVAGTVEQFYLRPGEVVNPALRPAGILIPARAGRLAIQAGFNQIEAQVIRPGMAAEVACVSTPFTVIPMVVTQVQDFIATGQVRASDQLVDPAMVRAPGTLAVYLEPLYPGGIDGVTPGSSCAANVYTSNHDRLANEDLGFVKRVALHAVDATAVVHAAMMRIQALMLPVRTLVLRGH